MKHIFLTLLLLGIVLPTFAQWTSSGGMTTTSDYIGVGLSNPLQRFVIKSSGLNTGSSSTDYDFGITDGASYPLQLLSLVNTNKQYGLIQVIQGGIGAKNLVLQSGGGNVGIGTTSPALPLEVAGDPTVYGGTAYQSTIQSRDTRAFATGVGGGITFAGNYTALPNNTEFAGIAGIKENNSSGDYAGALIFSTRLNGAVPAERLRISSSGNVGIGITSPAYLLDANGVIHSSVTAGSNLIISKNTGASVSFDNGAGIQTSLIEAGTNDNHLEFWTNTATNTGLIERMRVTNTGSLCIGTTNPGTYRLAVSGGIHAQSVNVDLTGWSDYVFNQDYKLPSLKELKNYIDQNHHLPDMPSEQEVIKGGINLGEMNKLLTKKVEELTLYLIEKDKLLSEEQKKNQQQDSRIAALEATLTKLTASK